MRSLRLFGLGSAVCAVLLSIGGCDDGPNEHPTEAAKSAPAVLTSCDTDQMELLDSKMMSWTDSAIVCRTMQLSLGRVPSLKTASMLSKLVALMRVNGDKTEAKEQAYQLMNIVEARSQTGSDEAMEATFDTVWKIWQGSQGHVTPRDINILLRSMGAKGASKLSDDGLITFAVLLQEDKKSRGE